MDPVFFQTPAALRAWFEQHQATEKELIVGFYKKGSGIPSVTWPESVDEALCVGWIDGVRRGLDAGRYTVRFTPRKAGSIWSAVNIGRVAALSAEGRMHAMGMAAFESRKAGRSGVYAYEQKERVELPEWCVIKFRDNSAAWAWFEQQAAWYRRTAAWRVISAKQEATRVKRLIKLIEASAKGERW